MSNKNYIYGDLYAAQSGGTIFSAGTALELIFGAGGGETLAQTLALGNTTNDGQTIEALNGGGQLDLRAFSVDGTVLLTTSAGTLTNSFVYLEANSEASFGYDSTKYIQANTNTVDIIHPGGVGVGNNLTASTVHANAFFSMAPYTGANPSSPSDNDLWMHSGATGTITLNYRIGGNNFSVELAP